MHTSICSWKVTEASLNIGTSTACKILLSKLWGKKRDHSIQPALFLYFSNPVTIRFHSTLSIEYFLFPNFACKKDFFRFIPLNNYITLSFISLSFCSEKWAWKYTSPNWAEGKQNRYKSTSAQVYCVSAIVATLTFAIHGSGSFT